MRNRPPLVENRQIFFCYVLKDDNPKGSRVSRFTVTNTGPLGLDLQSKFVTIPSKEVEALAPQRQSLMPELLVRDLTAQEVADLFAFLGALR